MCRYQEVRKALPILLATRNNNITVLEALEEGSLKENNFDFSSKIMNEENAHELMDFMIGSGLSKLFTDDRVKNLVDYVLGVEVGLDTNGWKNRGGKQMETVVGVFISNAVRKNPVLEYISEATPSAIKKKFGVDLSVDKSKRRFDFAVFNRELRQLYLIETNFYNGGGSKLKAVCGEFRQLNSQLSAQNIAFLWITDGRGWRTAEYSLNEAYDELDYTANLKMLEDGFLDSIFSRN